MQDIWQKASEAASYISERIKDKPQIAVILGSGLGKLAQEVSSDRVEISYSEIPNFPQSTVQGHAGKIIVGKIYGKDVIVMQGRFHYYEGYDLQDVTFPIRVFALLGVTSLIVSNAAGGINKKLVPTDLMLITDHLNMPNISPLRGPNNELFGARFPSMTEAYSLRLRGLAKEAAEFINELTPKKVKKKKSAEYAEEDEAVRELIELEDTCIEGKLELKEGVYAFMTGPQYETPAEIKMLDILGADVVGMSTVPEVILANQVGIEVLGISCVTNATGSGIKPTHEEVIRNADIVSEKFKLLVLEIIRRM
ncbi:MAG: purine-nucleoside phosphorylase [Clostridia bacterium]|nr:purine-nucleoside phosphorylase [Clostridia bacterium]